MTRVWLFLTPSPQPQIRFPGHLAGTCCAHLIAVRPSDVRWWGRKSIFERMSNADQHVYSKHVPNGVTFRGRTHGVTTIWGGWQMISSSSSQRMCKIFRKIACRFAMHHGPLCDQGKVSRRNDVIYVNGTVIYTDLAIDSFKVTLSGWNGPPGRMKITLMEGHCALQDG